MSAQAFESTLARLYTDAAFRNLFLGNPESALGELALTPEERSDLIALDKAGLVLASRSYFHKREKRAKPVSFAMRIRKKFVWFF
jgi:hypothetical protein